MREQIKRPAFRFVPFSRKQKKVLTWWIKQSSPYADYDCIIADGAIRSGKTLIMSLSYVVWAMSTFSFCNFGMAGKTIGSFKRNVWILLKLMLVARGYKIRKIADTDSNNAYVISRGEVENYFYIFGGKDERSQDLVQGFTAAGFFFDEVALMPESFVNQAVGRCSEDDAKLWFNCNPEGPFHWFKLGWIDKLAEKNAFRIQFNIDDNPSLSEKRKDFYKRMFSGVFYQRFILGLWVLAEGIIYDMFRKEEHTVPTEPRQYSSFYISIDYGTQNPTVFGKWGSRGNVWYKVDEYHHSGREGMQKTDEEYYRDLEKFVGTDEIKAIIIDPSAASFITLIKKRGRFKVQKAKNDVLQGIRNTSSAIKQKRILYNDCCKHTFEELAAYCWDPKASERGEDKPLKEHDHHMDADRYFVNTILYNRTPLQAVKSLPGRRVGNV
jgi:PBSX family phage terminase large subunit